jgi:hypothetical protein
MAAFGVTEESPELRSRLGHGEEAHRHSHRRRRRPRLLERLFRLLVEEKHANPSNYALVVLSEGASWEGYEPPEYGGPDAYGHRKKANVAEAIAEEIRRRTGEETIVSDLTCELRSEIGLTWHRDSLINKQTSVL